MKKSFDRIITIGSFQEYINEYKMQVLVEDSDFSDLDALTNQIEAGTLKFIKEIESFLSKTQN